MATNSKPQKDSKSPIFIFGSNLPTECQARYWLQKGESSANQSAPNLVHSKAKSADLEAKGPSLTPKIPTERQAVKRIAKRELTYSDSEGEESFDT